MGYKTPYTDAPTELTLKEKLKFKWKKLKLFMTKKRQFPVVFHINIGSFKVKDISMLKRENRRLTADNRYLNRKIKMLKQVIQMREMEADLNKKEDWYV